jgi:hypothetical protein
VVRIPILEKGFHSDLEWLDRGRMKVLKHPNARWIRIDDGDDRPQPNQAGLSSPAVHSRASRRRPAAWALSSRKLSDHNGRLRASLPDLAFGLGPWFGGATWG